jgi:hypothetical protein
MNKEYHKNRMPDFILFNKLSIFFVSGLFSGLCSLRYLLFKKIETACFSTSPLLNS